MTATAEQRLEKTNARLRRLSEAMERIQAAESREEVIDSVRDAAGGLCGADGVTVVLRTGDECHYVAEDAIGPLWSGQRFPLASCISGWAMLNRRTAVVPDVYRDGRVSSDVYRTTFVKSLITIPIGRDEPNSAIGVYWAEVRTPDAEEIHLMRAALEDFRTRYRERSEDAARLASAGTARRRTELDPADVAAWTMLAGAALTLHETLTQD